MSKVSIPKALHDIFGEEQSRGELAAVLAGGMLLFSAIAFGFRSSIYGYLQGEQAVGLARFALGMLLAFDIAAGCIANFTKGTSDFYAGRPINRLIFIAIHIHLPLFALLLGFPILPYLLIWAYTIGGAFLVNALAGRQSQKFIAGILLSFGLALVTLIPGLEDSAKLVSALFMLKVLYAFAVDHYGKIQARKDS